MPYTYYTKVTRDDALAIRAYLNTVPAVQNAVNADQLPFPFNIRAVDDRLERAVLFKPGTFQPAADKSAEWNRGAYLAEGLGALRHVPHAEEFSGRRQDQRTLARLRVARLVRAQHHQRSRVAASAAGRSTISPTYLKTGHNRTSAATGPMAETLNLSTSHMNDADLKAIAVYLKDQPGQTPAESTRSAAALGSVGDEEGRADLCRRMLRLPRRQWQRAREPFSRT